MDLVRQLYSSVQHTVLHDRVMIFPCTNLQDRGASLQEPLFSDINYSSLNTQPTIQATHRADSKNHMLPAPWFFNHKLHGTVFLGKTKSNSALRQISRLL